MPYRWSKRSGRRVWVKTPGDYKPLLSREDEAHLKHLKALCRPSPSLPSLPSGIPVTNLSPGRLGKKAMI